MYSTAMLEVRLGVESGAELGVESGVGLGMESGVELGLELGVEPRVYLIHVWRYYFSS